MVIHAFAFHWKPGVTDEQKSRVKTDIQAFQGIIPGLLETFVGANVSPRSEGYTFGGVMKFVDAAALAAYTNHPAHQELTTWLMPLIDPIELDIEA